MQPEIKHYEAHITIEPIFGERFDEFECICQHYKFKPAELLLQKTRQATPERSNKDSFATGHGKDYQEIYMRSEQLVNVLKARGFDVWRHKIEGIVFDHRETRLFKIKPVSS